MNDIELKAKALREKIENYQRAYYVDAKPVVSDLEYDRTFDLLLDLEKKYPELWTPDSPTNRVGSDLSSDFPEFRHTIPVLSLDKAYSSEAVLDWISKSNKKEKDLNYIVEEKIDGISIVLYYEEGLLTRAVTRGNGTIGNDVTSNVKTIKSVPLRLSSPQSLAVRGEIYMAKADFERVNTKLETPYSNPRNLTAGTIRRVKSSEVANFPLNIFVYEGFWNETRFSNHLEIIAELKKLGFRTNPHIGVFAQTKEKAKEGVKAAGLDCLIGSYDDIPTYIKEKTALRADLGYEIDGLVIKINDLGLRESLGYTQHHPRWAIAYKFEAPQAETVVKAIDVQVGRTGRVTPVARVECTRVGGSEIRNVTLHNQDYIDALELAIGDTVSISRRGDVIPAVENVTEKNEKGNTTWQMPKSCPVCGTELEKRGSHIFCPNYYCPAQMKGRLIFYAGKKQMDILSLGPGTLDFLFEKGFVREIQDLYTFDYYLLSDQEGFGSKDGKRIEAIRKGIENTKKASFKKVLTSLGIPEFGRKAVDLVVDEGFDSIEKLYDLAGKENKEELLKIKNLGERTIKLLFDSLLDPKMKSLILFLKEQGLQMKYVPEKNNIEQIFENTSWCVTGSFENFAPRTLAIDKIEERGGKVISAVSSKLDYLLAGEKAGSKLKKAEELGIKIINEKEFLEMLGEEKEDKEKEQGELF